MSRHTFSFHGGRALTTIGAVWFVSYLYHLKIDTNHRNWSNVSTANNRTSTFNSNSHYHKYWLEQVLLMNDSNLNKNSIGLSAPQIKKMATILLQKM